MEPNFVIIDNKYFISELEKTLKNDINTVTKNKYQVLAINLVKINSTTLYKIFNLFSKFQNIKVIKNLFKIAIKETKFYHGGKEKRFPYLNCDYGPYNLVSEYNFLISRQFF